MKHHHRPVTVSVQYRCSIVTSGADGHDRVENQRARIVRSSIFAVRIYERASRTDRRLMASRGGFITTAGGSYLEERSGIDAS